MSTTGDVITAIRLLVEDPAGGTPVFSDTLLTQFISEGVRRLQGYASIETMEEINANETNEFDLSAVLSYDCLELLAVLSLEEVVPEWEVFAGTLVFGSAPAFDMTLRYLRPHEDVTTLSGTLVDAVTYYAAGRALMWLVTKGGAQRQRYLARSGDLVADEVNVLGQQYLNEFFVMREEFGDSTTVSL